MAGAQPSIFSMGATDDAESWDAMVTVGSVARAHGRKGEVVVNVETDFPERRFRSGAVVYANPGGRLRKLQVVDVRFQSGRPVIALAGIDTIDGAESLAGWELRVPVSEQQTLPPDVYYTHELIGCEVRSAGADARLGIVTDVEGVAGAQRLLMQSASTGESIEIPLVDAICVRVDVERKLVVVEPPNGLLELNRRG